MEASGNLIKNVKSVIVPNTNGLSGIEAAVAAGLIAGRPEKRLEVISAVTEEEKRQIAAYLEKNCIQVRPAQSELTFDLLLTLHAGAHCVKLRIAENHTNIVLIAIKGKPKRISAGVGQLVFSLLRRMQEGSLKNLLFCATGALLSPVSTWQGESIPGICHAVAISAERR